MLTHGIPSAKNTRGKRWYAKVLNHAVISYGFHQHQRHTASNRWPGHG